MPDQKASYFLLALPIGLVLLANLVIYVLVMRRFCCDKPEIVVSSTQRATTRIVLQLRVSLAAIVLMGTWQGQSVSYDNALTVQL